MREMTCIVCPNGCTLKVEEQDGEVVVAGNKCKRGMEFATAELKRPMRTICSTVRTIFPEMPVVPVRVSDEIPKSRIFDVMEEINKTVLTVRAGRGDVLIRDVLGLGVDVIVASSMLKSLAERKGEK